MRKGVLGSIAALTAGAAAALGQGPPAAPGMGYGPVVPAMFGGPEAVPPGGGPVPVPGPVGLIPAGPPAPNGAPVYPPPGFYGAAPYGGTGSGADASALAPQCWVDVRYLLWFAKAQPTRVPYVTTSAVGDQGLAGRPTTTLLFSNRDLGYDDISGFRIFGGIWKGPDRRIGFELGGFLLEQKSNSYFAASDPNGIPLLARPFIDATTGGQASLIVSSLGLAAGNVLVSSSSRLFGAEGNGLANLYRSCPGDTCLISIDVLGGFRYLDLHETLNVSSASTLLGAGDPLFFGQPAAAPGTIGVRDEFNATNRFYGGQIGLKSEAVYGKWVVQLMGKVAAGYMNQELEIRGRSELLDPTRGINQQALGGLYANSQNIGTYRHDEFAVVPEAGVTVGYSIANGITTFIGYNFLYVNRVIRPGNAVTNVVNPALLPASRTFGQGAVVPVANPALTQDEYWAQGVSFGILFRY